jgi:chromosome partitioning protein
MPTILPSPSPVIAVLSQKGGTGKTTLVRTLADVLRRAELDVLAVDLDPQGNLSDYFDVDPDAYPTIGEVLSGRARAADAIDKQMIPANLGLAEAELVLSGKMGRELTLKRALHESRRQFELILIDCPPALGLLTVNALVASTHALVSAEGEYFSLQGVEQVLEVMQLARENLNESLEWLGVVMNIADLRTNHSRDALKSLRESYDDRVFETVIRRSIRYPESAERGVSIMDYSPELGTDYLALADELLARLGDDETRERLKSLGAELAPPTPAAAPAAAPAATPAAQPDPAEEAAPAYQAPATPTGW